MKSFGWCTCTGLEQSTVSGYVIGMNTSGFLKYSCLIAWNCNNIHSRFEGLDQTQFGKAQVITFSCWLAGIRFIPIGLLV